MNLYNPILNQQRNLLSHYFSDKSGNSFIYQTVALLIGVIVLSLSSKISVPFYPVPMTLQTLAVLSIALGFGLRLSIATLVSWIALGILGAPVFANGAGFVYVVGPTGGYLAGFVVATLLLGKMADLGYSQKPVAVFFTMILGNIVIYSMGLLWLSTFIGGGHKLLAAGLYPFLLGDLAKVVIATAMFPTLWKWMGSLKN